MKLIVAPSHLLVADETWIVTALLHREHPDRKRLGKLCSALVLKTSLVRNALPSKYRYLLDWYHKEYATGGTWLRGVQELAGTGREIFAGVDPDKYVEQLCEGWE